MSVRRVSLVLVLTLLLLVAVFSVVLNVPLVRASDTIYIRANGSIEGTSYVVSSDNITYVFTADINDSIVVERSNIAIDGAGYTLQGTGGNGFSLSSVSNVTIKNANIKNYDQGIYLSGASNNRITTNNITNNFAGIAFSGSSNSNSITANNITANADGIDLSSSSSNSITTNNIANNDYGIELSWASNSNSITANNITMSGYDGIYLSSSSNSSISANNIIANNQFGIRLYSASNFNSITANNITANADGIHLEGSSNSNSITANNITNNDNGIELSGSSNSNSITANNITANSFDGIYLSSSSNSNSITTNNIANNDYGIELSGSSNNRITANNITNNYDGIVLSSSSNNSITTNNIANNDYGINLLNSASNNSITANNITANNYYGIWLLFTLPNNIYHNNFINNAGQVYSLASTNVWDDGYPSGGNYWSNYIDVDNNKGPYQNETGSDSIWDNPYIIDSTNMDRYPLAFPYETQPPTVTILSPENKTYAVNASIPLTFTVDEFPNWMGYSLNGQPNATITGNTTLPTISDGQHSVVVYANDTFGNMGNSDAIHFTVDTVAPSGSIIINSGDASTTSTSVTLTLTYTDATSGVYQVRFSNDGVWDTEQWESPASTKAWTLTSGDGTKTVYYQIKDNAGWSSTYSDTIVLDSTTPQGMIRINNDAEYTNTTGVTLTLLATDAGSGVSQMRFSNDGSTWSSWEPYATSKSWSLESGSGVKNVLVQFRDNAGLSVWAYDNITLDTVLPVANAGGNQNVMVGQSVIFNGSGSSDNMGIASYAWSFGDGSMGTGVTPTHTYLSEGTYTVSLTVTDVAGNTALSSCTVVVAGFIPEFPSAAMLILFFMLASAFVVAFKERRR